MNSREAFARSLRQVRHARRLTQEDFAVVSSRTYVSWLERGRTSPTLEKIEALSEAIAVHPLTLLTLTYLKAGRYRTPEELFRNVQAELKALGQMEESVNRRVVRTRRGKGAGRRSHLGKVRSPT